MWKPPALKIQPSEGAILQGFPELPEGLKVWRNRRNGYVVIACGYMADPQLRTKEAWEKLIEGMLPHEIDSEYLCSFASRGGMKAFPWLNANPQKFTKSFTNYRRGDVYTIPNHWHLIGGLDYGGNRNPTSFHIYAIDEKKDWHSIYEYYRPSHFRETAEAIMEHPLYDRLTKIVLDATAFKRDQHVQNQVGAFTSIAELLSDAGVHILERANNDRLAGLARCFDLFNQRPGEERPTRFYISDDCINQWRELTEIVYQQESALQLIHRNPSEDVEKKNDHCFVAGTLIHTNHGYVPIEKIKVGEMVLTRGGFMPVISSGQTGVKKTMRLYFSGGSVLTCTGNHPIFTTNRGFVRADELNCNDVCLQEKNWSEKKSFSTGLFSEDTLPPSVAVVGNILDAARGIVIFCTEWFGSFIEVLFQMVSTCTIKMATTETMISRIWNVFPKRNTTKSIETKISLAQILWRGRNLGKNINCLPRNGTSLTLEVIGTASILRRHGKSSALLKRIVDYVRKSLRLKLSSLVALFFVPINVRPQTEGLVESTTLKLIVQNAESYLQKIDTQKQKPAEESVARLLRTEKSSLAAVYNISVENFKEYFANGILCHNSYDDFRYALMGWDAEAEVEAAKPDSDFALSVIEDEIDEEYEKEMNDLFN